MLDASRERILARLGDDALVLDVGGWAKPFARADWVLDLLPYETRGLYGYEGPSRDERFSARTWVVRDICAHEPWPFAEDQFDFAICSHTLEDVRDPVWVCHELCRIAKAGYVEVPSRMAEQSHGVQGDFLGWSHHRWLVDVTPGRIEFVSKAHQVHDGERYRMPAGAYWAMSDEQRVQSLWWEGGFEYGERILMEPQELDAYLADFVAAHAGEVALPPAPPPGLRSRVKRLVRR